MITKEKIKNGIKEKLVRFVTDPNMGGGTVCKIGDWWFYFGGEDAADMAPEEYIVVTPIDKIVNAVHEVLEEFAEDEELKDEYDYYDYVLTYCNGY